MESTITELSQQSIDFGRAIADLGALAVIGGVFMVFVLLMLSFFVYQLFTQQKKLSAIAEFSGKAMGYFEDTAMRNVNLDQARGLISFELERAKNETVIQVVKIKQKNNLDDTDAVQDKIVIFLDRLYSSSVSLLRKFDFQGKSLSTFMESNWKETVKKQMIKDCLNHEIDIHRLEESYIVLFSSFKASFNSKIDEI
ncbi:MAG: hypothetical protein FWF54_03220 [Candidatus Azobacteroides sp.]|nr:hypothetical protein [Candidatus Azobacteroides sp.]